MPRKNANKDGGWSDAAQPGKKGKGSAPAGKLNMATVPQWQRDAMRVQEGVQEDRGNNKESSSREEDGWETKGGYGGKTWGQMNAKERRKAERALKFKEDNRVRDTTGAEAPNVPTSAPVRYREEDSDDEDDDDEEEVVETRKLVTRADTQQEDSVATKAVEVLLIILLSMLVSMILTLWYVAADIKLACIALIRPCCNRAVHNNKGGNMTLAQLITHKVFACLASRVFVPSRVYFVF
jgi:hypothetical protein